MIIGSLSLLLFLCVGYAAFSTNLSLTAKGNIKERNNLYVSSNGSDTTGNGTINKPYATIQKAYDSAWQNSTIYVMDDINQTSTVTMNENKNIILTSYNNNGEISSIIRNNNYTNYLIEQTQGTLTLNNITVDGNNVPSNNALLSVTKLTLNTGTTIKNGINNQGLSGAIELKISNNTSYLTIDGATISNNQGVYGGAIHSVQNTMINILDGKITNNTSTNAGGAIYMNGNAKITGGEISNNKTIDANNGGAIAMISSTTATENNELIINGGIIKNNSAYQGGAIILYTNSSQYHAIMKIEGGQLIENNANGGGGGCALIYHNSELIMTGGTISNNTAVTYGGGIRVEGGTFTLNGGIIKNNDSNTDGGISVSNHLGYTASYNYIQGTVCGNTPANKYETSATCPN